MISVSDAENSFSSLQLSRTEMSPASHSEHSRKHRQRTGSRKKGAGNLPVISVSDASNSLAIVQNGNVTCESFGTFAEASSADLSAKRSVLETYQ